MIVAKLRKIHIEEVEQGVLEWLGRRKYRIPLFVFIVLMIWFISRAPYFNLFFNLYLVVFVSIVLSAFVLDINARLFFAVVPIIFLGALFLWFIEKDIAERLGEYAFIILLSGILRTLFSKEEEGEIHKNNNQRK